MTGVVEGARGDAHGTQCLNCGAALVGRYCHACGQSSHVHRTLASIWHDLLHGVFHFEGKIWRTLPMLALRPGELTRRYIDGERARFVSPLALFLFTVFLMFATLSALGSAEIADGFAHEMTDPAAQLDQARGQQAAELAAAERERARLTAAGQPTAAMDARIAEVKEEAADLAKLRAGIAGRRGKVEVRSELDWLNARLQKAEANPGLVIYKMQNSAYKYSWALIVLSTPLMALLFLWRRRFGLYDHATFVTYSISFMSLLFIAVQLMDAANLPKALYLSLLFLVPPVHIFVQLRGAYRLGTVSALWRTVAVMGLVLVTLMLFTFAMIVLGVS